jgi:hypothetical protein
MREASYWRARVRLFGRYTENARRTVVRAKHEADRFGLRL